MITVTAEHLVQEEDAPWGRPSARRDAGLLNQNLFRGALIRERKRADRTNRSLALVLIGVRDSQAREPVSTWCRVVEALSAVTCDTDVLGWFEQQTAVGLIVPEVPVANSGFVRELETRIRCELGRALDLAPFRRLSVRVFVHPGPRPGMESVECVDPLLMELRPKTPAALMNDVAKRALDIMGSLSLLTLLAPLFVAIAALIKLTSRGPVFFRQVRIGENARPFTMLKFRSMRVHASAAIHQEYVTSFIKGGPLPGSSVVGSGNPVFKLTNDPRITPIGNFLRKTSLDELPQLWNVLCGTMSLVGPRPPLQYEVDQYKPWHCRRVLEAKPGITGLWQVEGRSRTTFDEMVRLDLRYARSCSLWTDLKILLATPAAVIAGKGAC
jgi:lipopolysaccharide/colanic/teichoic acid biosynthesis glycosyltransferase